MSHNLKSNVENMQKEVKYRVMGLTDYLLEEISNRDAVIAKQDEIILGQKDVIISYKNQVVGMKRVAA